MRDETLDVVTFGRFSPTEALDLHLRGAWVLGGRREQQQLETTSRLVKVMSPLEEFVRAGKPVTGRALANLLTSVSSESEVVPKGIFNKGTTCYVNVILQTLLRCPPFTKLLTLLDQLVRHDADTHNGAKVLEARFPMLHHMYAASKPFLFSKATAPLSVHHEAVDLVGLLNMLNVHPRGGDFQGTVISRQHDAQEFLLWLLDQLNSEQVDANSHGDDDVGSPSNGDVDGGGWQEVAKGGKTPGTITEVGDTLTEGDSAIADIFGGVSRSTVQKGGSKPTTTAQAFFTISLDIQNKHIRSIEDALADYMSPEYLTSSGSPAERTLRYQKTAALDRLPQVLVFHLKRFSYNPHFGEIQKVGKTIQFPALFKMPQHYLSARLRQQLNALKAPSPQYRLFSVVYHHGNSVSKGHYTATVAGTTDKDKWFHYDDKHVTEVHDPVNHPERVYMLFYERS